MRILIIILSFYGFMNLPSDADKILNKTIKAHGGDLYEKAHYSFDFRNKNFEFRNNGSKYYYKSKIVKDGKEIIDELDNKGFIRKINGAPQSLSEKEQIGYGNSLNSVIYFATLPHKLKDKAVKKKYIGQTKIQDQEYEVLEISFLKEGGGTDHDDVFYYWINKSNDQIDFLAYKYHVNKGGVRFRTAENKRRVGGILFQDYVNYKADPDTPLNDLPSLWEDGKLKELSQIKTENVVNLK